LIKNYVNWGLGIGDWGLGVGGLGPAPQPPAPTPQTPNPKNILFGKNYKKKIPFLI